MVNELTSRRKRVYSYVAMKKHEAIALFGSVEALRDALGLGTRHAIYMWPDDEPIPEVHDLKIRYELKPEAFGNKPAKNKAA